VTAADLKHRILTRLDEDGAGYYSAAEALAAANEGQRLFVLLTLCNEVTAALGLTAAQPWYKMLTFLPDWLLPLRIRVAGAGGGKLAPCRLADLDALNLSWQLEPGTPQRYAHLGFDFLAIHPQPATSALSVNATYARSPVDMTRDADVPDMPEEYHPALPDYAIPRMRAKEGGVEFTKSLVYFDRFLAAADKLATYVRERNKAQGYDRGPYELKAFDRSKLIESISRKGAKIAK
jgi:hypothetical protein